jgi:hypothetical protein
VAAISKTSVPNKNSKPKGGIKGYLYKEPEISRNGCEPLIKFLDGFPDFNAYDLTPGYLDQR